MTQHTWVRSSRRTRQGLRFALALALVGSGLAAGATPAAGAGGSGTTPTLAPGLARVTEGDTGTTTVEVPVTLSEPTTETVTAAWQTIYGPGINPPDPATPGADFTAANGTITIAPGDTTATATIDITGDTIDEPDEFIVVAFTNLAGARPGGFYGLGFATIEDDDTTPTLAPGLARVTEGDTGTATVEVPVTLSEPTTETVTAAWQTIYGPGINPPDPATPGADFTAANGTITIAPGDTTATATIDITGDTIEEPDEFIVVAFTNITGARPGGFYGLGFVIIEDDDTPPLISPGTAGIAEGNTGTTTLAVPVTLSEPTTETVTVDWQTTVTDTSCAGLPISRFCATPGVDYVVAAGTITFPPGETTSYVHVQIVGDTIREEDEGLYIRLDNATNARLDSSLRFPYGVIEDDD